MMGRGDSRIAIHVVSDDGATIFVRVWEPCEGGAAALARVLGEPQSSYLVNAERAGLVADTVASVSVEL